MEAHLLAEHAGEDRHPEPLRHGLPEDREAAVGHRGAHEGAHADDHEDELRGKGDREGIELDVYIYIMSVNSIRIKEYDYILYMYIFVYKSKKRKRRGFTRRWHVWLRKA